MNAKKALNTKYVEVVADWKELSGPSLMGMLHIRKARGSEVFSFEYDQEWLKSPPAIPLDPDLQLFQGEHFPSQGHAQFGVFLDSAPDRWGRLLMRRRESVLARGEERSEKNLYESDYLLGIHDESRTGGLRFRDPETGSYYDSSFHKVPPWTSLRELEDACRKIEDDELDSQEFKDALRMILAPGSSLGGARPKASVKDEHNDLWIAKFPSKEDSFDSGAWEKVVHNLAQKCGINVPESKIQKLARPEHTFMVRRFDREAGSRNRIHFVSAMTLLQRRDGDDATIGASYLELVDIILSQGSQPNIDLEELWKRIVFSMLVSNCDDHLRNHGFLLNSSGWSLSPAYDINPSPQGNGLKLNVSENDNSQDLTLSLEVAPYFRVQEDKAQQTISHMKAIVSDWECEASKLGLSNSEKTKVARAFRLAK